jgi:hypothetical protein
MTKRIRIVLTSGGLIVAAYFVIQWFRADYLAFADRREDWHRRCAATQSWGRSGRAADQALTPCQRELNELWAYARRKGWADWLGPRSDH